MHFVLLSGGASYVGGPDLGDFFLEGGGLGEINCLPAPPTPLPLPELQEYFGGLAPPVTEQPPLPSWTPPSILETHTAQMSARRDWEAEWGGAGLASRLPPQVRPELRGGHLGGV